MNSLNKHKNKDNVIKNPPTTQHQKQQSHMNKIPTVIFNNTVRSISQRKYITSHKYDKI